MNSERTFDAVQAAEIALLAPMVRCDRAAIEQLLHPDFVEIGRSGRLLSRSEVVDALAAEQPRPGSEPGEWDFHSIADHTVLVTYRLRGPEGDSRHSSIWDTSSGAPAIRFHQGTWLTTDQPQAR